MSFIALKRKLISPAQERPRRRRDGGRLSKKLQRHDASFFGNAKKKHNFDFPTPSRLKLMFLFFFHVYVFVLRVCVTIRDQGSTQESVVSDIVWDIHAARTIWSGWTISLLTSERLAAQWTCLRSRMTSRSLSLGHNGHCALNKAAHWSLSLENVNKVVVTGGPIISITTLLIFESLNRVARCSGTLTLWRCPRQARRSFIVEFAALFWNADIDDDICENVVGFRFVDIYHDIQSH